MFRLTYTSAVLGTSLVGGIAAHATVLLHGNEVEGAVETALDRREINIEGELVVHESEHLVLGVAVHEVESGADVGAVVVLGDELEREGIAADGGAIGSAIVGTLEQTLGRAVGTAAASAGPLVAVVAVLAARVVKPAPVGVDDDLSVDRRTLGLACALLP